MATDKIEQADTLTSGQRNLLNQLTELLGGQVGEGVKFDFEGPLVPGIDPLQQETFDIGGQFLRGEDALAGDRQGALRSLLGGPEEAVNIFDEFIAPRAELDFDRFIEQAGARFGGQGRNGALQSALIQGAENFGLGLNAQRGQFAAGALDRLGAGVQLSREEELSRLRVGSALGGERRGIEGEFIGADVSKYLFEQPFNNPFLTQFLAPSLGTTAFQNVIRPTKFGQVASILGGIFSPPSLGGGGGP